MLEGMQVPDRMFEGHEVPMSTRSAGPQGAKLACTYALGVGG